MTTALLFPGQGSQAPGMRQLVEGARPDLLELAIGEVGEDPFSRVEEGTAFAQPALYCASIALWEAAGRPRPPFAAGHSLGELAALAAAGSITTEDGLRLAARRGRLMQDAADSRPDGGMLALLGDDAEARRIAARNALTIANDNAPGQVVLSGPGDLLDAAAEDARRAGLRAVGLAVKGAFHTPAMARAVPQLRAALAAVEVREPRVTVLSSITARPFDDIRGRLAEALVRPVRWRQTLGALNLARVRRYVEVGPGKVLKGLVRRTLPDVEALTLEELETRSRGKTEPAHA
jgi:[acyl-carrier-protein] S-malonyltransferase